MTARKLVSAGLILLLFSAIAASGGTTGALEMKNKKLIEFGWDEPGTSFLREHIGEMEKSPFDGCVFHADYVRAPGRKGSFTWDAWGTNRFEEADLKGAFEDLKSLRTTRLKHNFLRFNTTPAKMDWFEDHDAVIENARLAARLVRAGKCAGVLFDIEQYDAPLFDYRKQRDAKTKSWEVYAAQVRRRGRDVMDAFQEGYPGLTVFLTFGYSLPWQESQNGKLSLADCHYGLLAPFVDGMVDSARGRARLVDGHELSYGYKEEARFASARRTMESGLLPIVRDPLKYRQTTSFSFGLWMDRDWRKNGWDVEDVAKNYFTPEAFQTSVNAALNHTDEFVWIYTETPRWWSKEGAPVKLPKAYDEALRRARGVKGNQ